MAAVSRSPEAALTRDAETRAAPATIHAVAVTPIVTPAHRPRALTPAVRKQVGLPFTPVQPYSWPHAWVFTLGFGVPLAIAGYYGVAAGLGAIALVFMPLWRRFEHKTATAGEALYRDGAEAIGRVIDNEPAGKGLRDHLVRVEYVVDEATVQARVVGAPLARKGLRPGDVVLVIHDRVATSRALIIERVSGDAAAERRAPPAPTAEELADETRAGGCGGGGCGGCASGACGSGGCGSGGCGSGGCGGG